MSSAVQPNACERREADHRQAQQVSQQHAELEPRPSQPLGRGVRDDLLGSSVRSGVIGREQERHADVVDRPEPAVLSRQRMRARFEEAAKSPRSSA
jgi:hypothetical protein